MKQKICAIGPAIPFAPIGKNTLSLSWGLSLCRDALQAALCAAGADSLPDGGENGVPSWVRQAIFRKYLGGDAWSRKKHKVYKVHGLIAKTSMDSGARTLRAIWWNHFVDRDVLSALLGITWRQWTVAEYLKYARYRPALLKVAAEHRNLLPVLMEINPQQWGRDDLFSRKLWVRDGRKSTALDRRPVRSEDGDRIRSFESATSWRWLSRASSLIVREWAAVKNNAVIEDLALANCGGIHGAGLRLCEAYSLCEPDRISERLSACPPVLPRLSEALCLDMERERLFRRATMAPESGVRSYAHVGLPPCGRLRTGPAGQEFFMGFSAAQI